MDLGIPQPPASSLTRRAETAVEVQELRNQVKMLSHELRQLRTEFSGSMQHLHTIDEGAMMAPIMNQSASVLRLEEASNGGGKRGDMDVVKPPLPPRLCK